MKVKKTKRIDISRKRIAHLADKYYNEGNYLAALRLAHREYAEYGGDPDVFARLCDIYESMGLHGTAVNYWLKFLDVAADEDLPDVYEGLAASFLAIGKEKQAAYYYNRLIDADDTLTEEDKLNIAEAFSEDSRSKFRFVYPPKLADYSTELTVGAKALKSGDLKKTVSVLDKVAKGSKDYAAAKEMQAVAYLLDGKTEKAEEACKEILSENPNAVQVLATLAAVYLEQGRKEESLAIARQLSEIKTEDTDDSYKIATVCCENELHDEAYQKFAWLDKKMSYDGRILYFKGVSAYNSGRMEEAKRTLDQLCTIYPDAEVAKYYLQAIRTYEEELATGGEATPPQLIYFYHLPQEERESRCQTLLQIGGCPKDEAQIFGLLALHDGYFTWCFDEMDGGDRDLQYLALVTAAHVRADEFLQDVLLDYEVSEVLKVEVLRMLIERNEDMDISIVMQGIYGRIALDKISIGRKRRKKFLEGYAKLASKFAVVDNGYLVKMKEAAEKLYRDLERSSALDLVDNADDVACAVYFLADLHDLGKDRAWIASAFDANLAKVHVLLSYTLTIPKEEKENETY